VTAGDGWFGTGPERILMDFNRSTQEPDPSGRNLQPGQCTPADFPLNSYDPARILGYAGQVPGDGVDSIWVHPEVGTQHYIAYLKNPNNYWSFEVYDTGDRYFAAHLSEDYYTGYWKPELYRPAVRLVGRTKTPPDKGVGRVKEGVPTGVPPRPICEVAREARARNSPAAAGLETQCRAAGAAGEAPIDVDGLAIRGESIANADPLSAALRDQQPEGLARRGFYIGLAAAEGQTAPGPAKQRVHDSLGPYEQAGFTIAVLFSLERNQNAKLASTGAAIAEADPIVAESRSVETDIFYRLGFDIATGIFGDPALGAQGNTATGPNSLGIRNSLSAAGQRGFNASVALHLGRNYKL